MVWIDGHCDVLSKMWRAGEKLSFYEEREERMDVMLDSARMAPLKLQVFAIYIPEAVSASALWEVALQQVDIFYERIIGEGKEVRAIATVSDLDGLQSPLLGAILALEGADALQGELYRLRTLYRLGVRQMGLTWNYANEVADGALEERGGGLTAFGRQVVEEMESLQMILDVSHLSEKAFWDVLEVRNELPVIASHSNCYTLCPHVRNLRDTQIEALIKVNGVMGLTFVPPFVDVEKRPLMIDDLLRHVDHICRLGGENHLAFGSDFDGYPELIYGLEHAGKLAVLAEELLRRYPSSLVEGWMYKNWENLYRRTL
ncbi:dipeptidase [Mechercharimyces sp. CAU 1602]|uniref:dipeptidase n=1 Tax=Mechercharimyces sp. CAU 1602 TaxID=2973933 RepID=UPI0021622E38|nr:dipeptidase [Mechercharimyces sp. CAU 1602]MCS1351222.1 dipeptidase [Mechercharimyces sp. CAU 1602]